MLVRAISADERAYEHGADQNKATRITKNSASTPSTVGNEGLRMSAPSRVVLDAGEDTRASGASLARGTNGL